MLECVWLTSLVLGLDIGCDKDASKTAWLGWRWKGYKQVPDTDSRVTLPLGPKGEDVTIPRVSEWYKHLGTELASPRIFFGHTTDFFPELRFIEKHTTCNDLTLLRGPHPAAQKGWTPRQGRPRQTLVSWIPYSQLVPLGDGALPYSPVHRGDAGEEVRQAGGLLSLLEQVKWRRPWGRANRNSVAVAP